MSSSKKNEITCVLFDIDGTLLDMRGAGRRAFAAAVEQVLGCTDSLDYVNFAGNTDLNVLRQVFAHHHRELTEDLRRAVFARMPVELERAAASAELVLYPGVKDLLEMLSDRKQALLGLVTGNIEACAWIKLRQFNLHGHFVLGGFGDHWPDRPDIARTALHHCRNHLPADSRIKACYLIGDTPFDISAAHHIGAVSIGVATGKFSVADLQKAGAQHALPNLADTAGILRLMGLTQE